MPMKPDTLIAEVNLQALLTSIRLSVAEIEEKHPNRTDLIEPMRKHEQNLKYAIGVWNEREYQLRQLNKKVAELLEENLRLRQRNNFLEI
jgi:uncharacterized NAD(P)/FAD-binding protein YdhS